jgi:hypothetical protein
MNGVLFHTIQPAQQGAAVRSFHLREIAFAEQERRYAYLSGRPIYNQPTSSSADPAAHASVAAPISSRAASDAKAFRATSPGDFARLRRSADDDDGSHLQQHHQQRHRTPPRYRASSSPSSSSSSASSPSSSSSSSFPTSASSSSSSVRASSLPSGWSEADERDESMGVEERIARRLARHQVCSFGIFHRICHFCGFFFSQSNVAPFAYMILMCILYFAIVLLCCFVFFPRAHSGGSASAAASRRDRHCRCDPGTLTAAIPIAIAIPFSSAHNTATNAQTNARENAAAAVDNASFSVFFFFVILVIVIIIIIVVVIHVVVSGRRRAARL